jgi:hypothetical protein
MIPRMKLLPILAVLAVSLALVAALPVALGAPHELPPAEPALDVVPDHKSAPQVAATAAPQATPESPSEQELTPDGWQIIAAGIDYREFHLPDPNNVFVARMERANQDVILESSIAEGLLNPEPEPPGDGFETVSGMAQRYDQTINYWDEQWGNRNHVVVAVNGDYTVRIDDTHWLPLPQRGQIYSEWYARRFPEFNVKTTSTGFVWKTDRSAFINDGCVEHPDNKQFVAYIRSGSVLAAQEFDNVNVPREQNQFILYTPQFDATTKTGSSDSVEVLVQLSRPASISLSSDMTRGTIVDIRQGKGSTPIPFDHVVLSMHGNAKSEFNNYGIHVGDEIGIAQRVKNCANWPSHDWIGSYAGIGGDYYFLKDGAIENFPTDAGATARHPRTSIAYNDQYIYFIVVDGRDPFNSIGMTINELAKFAKNTLEATYGIAEDGGGSSTMVVNGVVKNNTFCNNVFCKGQIFLPLIVSSGSNNTGSDQSSNGANPSPSALSTPVPDPENGTYGNDGVLELDPNTGVMQRALVNGMLMVVVEPITQTETFTTSQTVTVYSPGNLRLGPGTNYASLGTLPAGTNGTVLDDSHGLNGVLATGYNWWKVDFGSGLVGWMNEQSLTPPSAASYLPYSFWDLRRPR